VKSTVTSAEYSVVLGNSAFAAFFDVAANTGDWAMMAHRINPQAEIHLLRDRSRHVRSAH